MCGSLYFQSYLSVRPNLVTFLLEIFNWLLLHQEINCTVFRDLHKIPPYLASAHLSRFISHPLTLSSLVLLNCFEFSISEPLFSAGHLGLSFPCICTHGVLCLEYLSPCNLHLLALSHASEFNSDAIPFGKPILSLLLRWSGCSQYNLSLLKSNCQVNIAFPCPYIKEPTRLSAHDQTWMPWNKPYGHCPSFTENTGIGSRPHTTAIWGQFKERGVRFIHSMDMSLSKLQQIVKDREAWHVAVHGVSKSQIRLSDC